MPIRIITDKCNGCQLCIPSCPYGAIGMEGDKAILYESCVHCGICIDSCPVSAIVEVSESGKTEDAKTYRNILVIGEASGSSLTGPTKGLLNKAKDLAGAIGVNVWMAAVGINENIRGEIISFGANEAFDLEGVSAGFYNTSSLVRAISDIIEVKRPEIVLFSETPFGCDVAPRIAQRFMTGLLSGCISLEVDIAERILYCKKPLYGGRLMAITSCPKHKPQIAVINRG
ncbi:MAG: 4Fe-4S binding protein [Nitrospirae bacterium]|nr:4Fe-4S binding protein [Nitrospirota bacterium]